MNDLEKIKRYLSKPIPITIKNQDGEDVIYFKPLNVEQQAILMELSKIIKSRETIEVEGKKVPDVKKEDMTNMFELLLDVVKNSIEGIDDGTAKDFVNTNFDQLSDSLFELIPENQNKEKINLIKKKMEAAQNAKSTTESRE